MLKMKEPKYVAETLKWCNVRRKEKGNRPLKRLPKGKKSDPLSCPCGKATGIHVGLAEWAEFAERADKSKWKPLPDQVVNFVLNFDLGKLPQYEL